MKRFNLPQNENSMYRILCAWEFGTVPFCLVMFRTGGGGWRGQLVINAAKGNWTLECPRVTMIEETRIVESKPQGSGMWRKFTDEGLFYQKAEWERPKRLCGISETWWQVIVAAVNDNRAAWS